MEHTGTICPLIGMSSEEVSLCLGQVGWESHHHHHQRDRLQLVALLLPLLPPLLLLQL